MLEMSNYLNMPIQKTNSTEKCCSCRTNIKSHKTHILINTCLFSGVSEMLTSLGFRSVSSIWIWYLYIIKHEYVSCIGLPATEVRLVWKWHYWALCLIFPIFCGRHGFSCHFVCYCILKFTSALLNLLWNDKDHFPFFHNTHWPIKTH